MTGGASQIPGALELAERVFQVPVRIGLPQHVTGLADVVKNPMYATGVGLLLYGYNQRYDSQSNSHENKSLSSGKGLWQRMKSWFQGNF